MASLEPDYIISESYYNDNIIVTVNKHRIASICLNRVDKHNALNDEMLLGINNALDTIENYLSQNNGNIRALVLESHGKSFCAGADLNSMQQMVNYDYNENYQDAINLARVLDRINNFPAPTIAKIQGSAFGGGIGLISCCDFAVAMNTAKFCLSEVKLGIIPAVISPYLIETMGYKKANRLALSAELIDSSKALELDLISYIALSEADLNNRVNSLLDLFKLNSPAAMQRCKSLFKEINNNKDDINKLGKTAEEIAKIRISPEGQEGLLAFIEKRKPNWVINK